MKISRTAFQAGFHVLTGNSRSQAAVMVLEPGEKTGELDESEHPHSDQWLYVAAGEGLAVVEGRERELKPGTVLLIEAGEGHEIRNTGSQPLETVNFYVPPAYTADGEPVE